MGNKLYVGNLSFSVNSDSLTTLFNQFGRVESAKVIMDRDTGRSKGFGFVEMSNSGEAGECIRALAGHELEGRAMNVSEAKPMEEKRGGLDRSGRGGLRDRY